MKTKRIYTYIIAFTISVLWLTPQTAHAQFGKRKPKVAEPDTVAWFRGVAVSVDAVGAAQRWLSDYGQYEAALRVNLKDRYYPVVELGLGDAHHENVITGIEYKARAPYGRIGIDFNAMKNKHDDYRLYLGGRYGFTTFDYDLSCYRVADTYWEDESPWGEKGNKGNCHWLEAVVGIDTKIMRPVRLGWSVRYRSRLAHKKAAIGEPWYVPGYGISGSSVLGATFNIILEL